MNADIQYCMWQVINK